MSDLKTPYQFRSALNGFHREDVVAYIESTSREYEMELQQLRSENHRLTDELENLRNALDQARQNEDAARRLSETQERLQALEEEKIALTEKVKELEEAAAQKGIPQPSLEAAPVPAQTDLDAPILPVGEVMSTQLSPSKDFSELELAAYRRAEMTERLARDRAQDVYRQVQSVFRNATAKMDTGKADLETVTKTLQGNVSQLMALLSNIYSAYHEAEISFGEVSEQNRRLVEEEKA